MTEGHLLVEVLQVAGILRKLVRRLGVMAVVAANHDWVAFMIFLAGINHGHEIRPIDRDWIQFVALSPSFQIISI